MMSVIRFLKIWVGGADSDRAFNLWRGRAMAGPP